MDSAGVQRPSVYDRSTAASRLSAANRPSLRKNASVLKKGSYDGIETMLSLRRWDLASKYSNQKSSSSCSNELSTRYSISANISPSESTAGSYTSSSSSSRRLSSSRRESRSLFSALKKEEEVIIRIDPSDGLLVNDQIENRDEALMMVAAAEELVGHEDGCVLDSSVVLASSSSSSSSSAGWHSSAFMPTVHLCIHPHSNCSS